MTKRYSYFAEINKRLKILKLQQKIDIESLKLNVAQTKNDLYPSRLMSGFNGIFQEVVLTLVIKKLSGLFRKLKPK
jgi:hypothetical protein